MIGLGIIEETEVEERRMVLYIHGFASSGRGEKARMVRNHFGKKSLAPTLSHIPDLALDTLSQIVERILIHEPVYLIGSSLGGFYAIELAELYDLKAVLVNPATEPHKTLTQTGMVPNFYDLSRFEWSPSHIETLKRIRIETIGKPEKYLVLLQTGDDVLDYRVAKERLKGAKMIIEEGGSHVFKGFENHLKTIENFFES